MSQMSLSRTWAAFAIPFMSAMRMRSRSVHRPGEAVADSREAVVLDESKRESSGEIVLAREEDALPGHEDVSRW